MSQQSSGPRGPRGIAYVRVSSETQETDRQHTSIKLWADKHRAIPRTLEDVGRRHEAASRPQFQSMMRAVQAGEVDWIVLDAIDRLGFADPLEWGYYAHLCRSNNVEIWSASEDKCLTRIDAATVLTSNISAIGSHAEMTRKAERDLGKKREMTSRGDFVGGWCPYGCDVVALGRDGLERWRVVAVGKWLREKRHVGGLVERYDGKGNFPPRAAEERLVLRPTVVTDRLKALRLACERIADGQSMNATAKELNSLGLQHPHGRWFAVLLKGALTNPVLIGRPSYNKSSNAQYASLEGRQPTALGEEKHVKPKKRPRSEWLIPEQQFEPLVDPGLVERMLARLGDRSPGKRAPRNSKLWLSGLLHCKRCGKPMVGWAYPADKKTPYSYACPTYRRYGTDNATGCRLHRVSHPSMERIIDDYLGGLEATILEVRGAGETGLLGLLFDQRRETFARLSGLRDSMEHFLLVALERILEPEPLPEGRKRFTVDQPGEPPIVLDLPGSDNPAGVQQVYGWVRSAMAAKSRARVAEIEVRLRVLVGNWSELPTPYAKQLCAEEMTRLEGEREGLDAGLTDLGVQVRDLFGGLISLHSKVKAAKAGADTAKRSEVVRSIVERVELEFDYSTHGQQVRSHLVRATVVPIVDAPERTFAFERASAPG